MNRSPHSRSSIFGRRPSPHRRGFTLMEVLLVLAILGVIAAIVVPNIIGTQEKGNIRAAKLGISKIESAVNLYAIENSGRMPKSMDDLTKPYEKDGKEQEPFLPEVPTDPWGEKYNFQVDPKTGKGAHQKVKMADIWSNGPNGEDDKGENDDVTNFPSGE